MVSPPSPSQQWATSFQAALDAQSLAAWTLAEHYLENDELNWGEKVSSERPSPLDFAIGYSHAWGVALLLKNGLQVTPTSVYYAVQGMYLKRDQPEVLQQRLDTIWPALRPVILAHEELRDTAVACFLDRPWDSVEKHTRFMWEAMGMAEVSVGRLAKCLDSRFYKARLSPLQLAWLSGWPEAMLLLLEAGSSPCQVWADSAMPNWSLHRVVEAVEKTADHQWSEKERRKHAADTWPSVEEKVRSRIPLAFDWSSNEAPLWKVVQTRVRELRLEASLPAATASSPRPRF